jgi:hypothetical protein
MNAGGGDARANAALSTETAVPPLLLYIRNESETLAVGTAITKRRRRAALAVARMKSGTPRFQQLRRAPDFIRDAAAATTTRMKSGTVPVEGETRAADFIRATASFIRDDGIIAPAD